MKIRPRQRTRSAQAQQTGLSLIELMVALVLGLLLIAAAIQIFLGSKQTYRTTEASSRVQENGRFANLFLSQDLRMAGYFGCLGQAGMQFTNNVDGSKFDSDAQAAIDISPEGAIQGFEIGTSGLPQDLSDLGLSAGTNAGDVLPDTEAVIVRHASQCPGGNVVQQMPDSAANIKIADAASCELDQNDIALITDCETADAFAISNNPQSGGGGVPKDTLTHANNINLGTTLSKSYGEDAWVYSFQASIYYLGNNTAGEPALYRRKLINGSLSSEELVEHVEDIAFEFGLDTNGDYVADSYRDTGSVSNWAQVVAARYSLVARSHEQNVTQTVQNYTFDGEALTGDDRRLRHVFTDTISLRNRLK
ncbi:hypothetical protein GM160_00545 [Guyparkeria halophila]|uniref:Prepilin-type N-terminal cleavage/methylation domain-containing protein n=1 Tax=Guyparkeria halophila TaxID=47960 RepID=A0A6I6CU35_9GAMM|nr:PilW family protein [Guyparkeria halophila]QGT77489.1 hypothetical protein GM160_00545 [Guyparkeria halophila]